MGATKKDYMDYYSYATLEEVIHKYNLDLREQEEEMYYACLGDVKTQYANEDCDKSPKDIE